MHRIALSRSTVAVLFLLGFILGSSGTARGEGAQFRPVIISFGGTGPVHIVNGADARDAEVGQALEYGSVIKTTGGNTVTVQYPDGSLLAVDADTEVQIQERTGGVQGNQLNFGQVRGSVMKLKTGEAVPQKPKFLIRTKAAVLGVRGTEFVMGVDPTGYATQVHTLEGVVDVAADESGLMAGKGVPVEPGKFVEATEKGGVTQPQEFVREEFAKSLKPATAGGPSDLVFSAPGGHSVSKVEIPTFVSAKKEVTDTRIEPDVKRPDRDHPQQRQDLADREEVRPRNYEPQNEPRRLHLASFQAGVVFSPDAGDLLGTHRLTRAASFSWDPTLPFPVFSFLWIRGHAGWIFGQDGSLYNRLWVNELQVFGSAVLFNRFMAEAGIGSQKWFHTPYQEGLFTTNVGLNLRDRERGFAIDRVFIGRSLFLSHPRVEEFKAGFGFSF